CGGAKTEIGEETDATILGVWRFRDAAGKNAGGRRLRQPRYRAEFARKHVEVARGIANEGRGHGRCRARLLLGKSFDQLRKDTEGAESFAAYNAFCRVLKGACRGSKYLFEGLGSGLAFGYAVETPGQATEREHGEAHALGLAHEQDQASCLIGSVGIERC